MTRESQKKARDKWDKQNMSILACKVKKEHAEKFKEYAQGKGTTANALLKEYVLETIQCGGESASEEQNGSR